MRRAIWVALPFVLLASTLLFTVQRATPQQGSTLPGARARTQFAPYYTINEGFQTSLMVSNTTRAPFIVTATLYSLSGTAAVLAPIPLDAHDMKMIDLAQVVAGLGGEFRSGSLRLDYTSVGYGLGAMVMMVNDRQSLEFGVLARPPNALKSSRLESLWWAPDNKARIRFAVLNTTEASVTGTMTLTDSAGQEINSNALNLAAHETKVFELDDMVSLEKTPLGGISIQHGAKAGALLAQGFVQEAEIGFSANLQFEDPATFGDSKLEGAGVLVGSGDTGPAGPRFTGHLLLRNISADPVTVNPVLQRGSFVQPLGATTLQSGDVREIVVPRDALPDMSDATGVEIKHTGPPGGLLGSWFSLDPTGNLVVETPLRSPAPNAVTSGTNPWSIQGDSASILYIKNTGDTKASYASVIQYAGGSYIIGRKGIAPGETVAIDIRKLRDERVPDANGLALPPDVNEGQALWAWKSGPPLVGRINTMSIGRAIASNMSCPGCCCQYDTWFESRPNSIIGPAGGSSQIAVYEHDYFCSGSSVYPVWASDFSWGSSNSSVASVDTGFVSCLSAGNATVTGTYQPFLADNLLDQSGPDDCNCYSVPPNPDTSTNVTVRPVIDSISPARGVIGDSPAITITGRGFGTSPTVNAGQGITVNITSSTTGTIHAGFVIDIAAPSGNHSVTVTANGLSSNSVNFFVQVPTSLSIVPGTDSTTPEASCSAGSFGTGCGVTRSFTYQIKDQDNPPQAIQAAGLQIWDEVNTTSPNNLGLTGYTTTCSPANTGPCGVTTNSVGQFLELSLGACSTVCRVNNACTTGGPTNANQIWHVRSSTITQSVSLYCDRVTVNGQ